MASPLMKITNLNKTFGTTIKTQILHDINLTVNRGEFLAIIGPSGSGKSTILNLVGALDPVTSGSIEIEGVDIVQLNDTQLAAFRNNKIGFIFQFHYLLPEFTALENVMMPTWIAKGRGDQQVLARAEELIELVGLTKQKNSQPSKMSGGQQQRIAIARALVNNPSIILADEPTGNLDSNATEQIYSLMRRTNQELKTTFIVITHDRHIAARADRVVEIIDGRIVSDTNNTDLPEEDVWEGLAPSYCLMCNSHVKKANLT